MKLDIIKDEAAWLEKRKGYITSTESSSLFGLQMPSLPTAFELWYIKRGEMTNEVSVNARMVWGRRMEDVIARGIAEDQGWKLNPMHVFAYCDDDRMGSSFDHSIECPINGHALLEIKTISYREYKEKFIEDDEKDADGQPVFIEAPPYYEVQVQHEMETLNRFDKCCLAVFIMDTRDVKLLWRDRDRDFGSSIRKKIREFWASEKPPAPDLVADSELLARMHRANSNDSALDATKNAEFDIWAASYLDETKREKSAKEEKKRLRSQMILAMGDNNTAWCNTARVSNKSKFMVTATKEKTNDK